MTVRRAGARLRRALGPRDALSALAVGVGHLLIGRRELSGRGFVSNESPLIIAGMHRSGTSMVARLLEKGGVYVGGSWVDRNHEALHFSRANRAMMGEGPYMLRDYGWSAPKTDDYIQARSGYAERAAARISVFFGDRCGQSVWGWKDPRNNLTLPVWLSIYPSARVLHVVRDGRSAALSLADRDGLDPAFGLALWAHYTSRVERALKAVDEARKLMVRFEDVVAKPTETLQKLFAFAGLEPVASLDEIAGHVDSGLAAARAADPRMAAVGDHPLLAEYGYH